MSKTRIAYALLALALTAVLGFLVVMTRSVDFDNHNDLVGTLRDLKQLDAEWNVDVLRSKTGLNDSYDPVASPLPLLELLDEQLQQNTESFWLQDQKRSAQLKPLLATYKKVMDEKIVLIESFKSQNAILRNSSLFLPVAAEDLSEAVHLSSVLGGQKQIEQSLTKLLTDTMSYALTSDADRKDSIEATSHILLEQVHGLGDDVQERAEVLTAHVASILKQQVIGEQILGALAALPVAKTIDALTDEHARQYDAQLYAQQTYAQILMAYSAFLLLLLGYIGWRLFNSYRLLNLTHLQLQTANDDLKESQVYMVQSEKMSALGQMVAGIAHEINTPLAYVKGTIDVLAEQLPPVKKLSQLCQAFTTHARKPAGERDHALAQKQLREVEEVSRDLADTGVIEEMETLLKDGVRGIEQISEIVLNLKNFSRLDRARVSEFSVQDGLQSTLLLLRNSIKDRIEIRYDYQDVPNIQCSPSQINQVFLNIISNAAQAMADKPEKGVITLRTLFEGGDMVRVEIQDNGQGIPKEVMGKIFDPFFTTKAIGQGTGMGLSISYKIIQQHGGVILVDSEPGSGTLFSILLPIASQEQSVGVNDVPVFAD
ncbi:hypothetical protein AwPolaro_09580 [Polaromonas sp.]|nr:hypothetical protein AwPolaro_09580 [Polaromonas sp.]